MTAREFVAPAKPPADLELQSGAQSNRPKPHLNAGAPKPTEAEIAAVQADRQRKRDQRLAKDAADDAIDVLGQDEKEPRGALVDYVEVDLPDGRKIEYGPPPNVSLSMQTAIILGAASANPTLNTIAQVCLSVRKIDGHPIRAIGDLLGIQKLANILGDRAIDILFKVDRDTWPPLQLDDMPAVRKTFRGA